MAWLYVALSSTPELVEYSDFSSILTAMAGQVSISSIVGILAVVTGASVGFVFLWWAVRKALAMIMKAFRKGKLSI